MSNTKTTRKEREEFIKKLEDEATENGFNSLSEYLVATGGDEIREILLRIVKTELNR